MGPCTPSVICVGTTGQFLAADAFGLTLMPGNSKDFNVKQILVNLFRSGQAARALT